MPGGALYSVIRTLLALLGGCASTQNPRDPLEPLNRAIYKVNDGLDKVIMKPVATAYKAVLPQFVRTGVTNFFSNLAHFRFWNFSQRK